MLSKRFVEVVSRQDFYTRFPDRDVLTWVSRQGSLDRFVDRDF